MKDTYANVEQGAVIHLMDAGDHGYIITSVGVQRSMRGQGAASQLLKRVCADADREGVTLLLAVEPDGTGLGRNELIAFYGRHGFSGLDAEDTMVREPRL
jgi:predicted GNAT family acetyltransferase